MRLAGEQDLLFGQQGWLMQLKEFAELFVSHHKTSCPCPTLFEDLFSMPVPGLAFTFSVPLATLPISSYSSLSFQDLMLKINFASRPN